jgi:hypothetical protein
MRLNVGDRIRIVSAPRDNNVDGKTGCVAAVCPGDGWQSVWATIDGSPRPHQTLYFRIPNDTIEKI